VNTVEDRIRDAFGAAADTIQQNNIRGLHDRRRSPQSAARKRITPLAAAVAVAVIIVGAAVFVPLVFTGQRPPAAIRPRTLTTGPAATHGPRTTQVPDVVGLSRAAASSELAQQSLKVRIVQYGDPDAPAGIVVAQAPAAGSQARAGATVTLRVASHPTPSATTPISSPPPAALRTVTSTTWQVSLSIPDSWTVTPNMDDGRFAYSGESGYVQVSAATESGGLGHSCAVEATSNVLHPYGSDPKIVYTTVGGQPACLIFPSADAPRWPQRAGGPAFQTSAAYIQYLHPVQGYQLLYITADPAHLMAVVQSIQLHQ
jgi:hypothetical protein